MISADRENAALFHRAIDVKNVIGRAAADIDDESAQAFLMLSEHDLRGSERRENNVFHIQR